MTAGLSSTTATHLGQAATATYRGQTLSRVEAAGVRDAVFARRERGTGPS
jgi:hypothetical protein